MSDLPPAPVNKETKVQKIANMGGEIRGDLW